MPSAAAKAVKKLYDRDHESLYHGYVNSKSDVLAMTSRRTSVAIREGTVPGPNQNEDPPRLTKFGGLQRTRQL
jgi:hypothetical protein